MGLPKSVQNAVDNADAFDAANAQPEVLAPGQEPALVAPPEPQTQVASPAPAAPEAPRAPADDPWEHRYKTLQGMYNAEVPRLHEQQRALAAQVADLSQKLESTKTQKVYPETGLVTDKDKELFGDDLLDVIRRSVHQETARLQKEKDELQQELRTLKGQVGNVAENQTASAQAAFFAQLGAAVPDYQALNVDPEFIAWLKIPDEVHGQALQAALDQSVAQWNPKRAIAIFQAFLRTRTPTQTTQQRTDDLRSQVAPSTKRSSGPPPQSQEKPIISQKQMADFYNNWRRGLISAKDAERIEAEINAAVAEGRVR